MDRTLLYSDRAHSFVGDPERPYVSIDGIVEGTLRKAEETASGDITLWIEDEDEYGDVTPHDVEPFQSVDVLGYGA